MTKVKKLLIMEQDISKDKDVAIGKRKQYKLPFLVNGKIVQLTYSQAFKLLKQRKISKKFLEIHDDEDVIYGCPYCGEELGDSIPDKCPACKMPIHREDVEVYKDESFKESGMTKAKKVLDMLEGTFDIGNDSSTHNIIVKINGVDKEFYKAPFGRQLDDLKKVKAFIEIAKTYYVGAKGKGTLAAVKQWVKETNPSEYYAKWRKDSSNYKDDSVQIYYKD